MSQRSLYSAKLDILWCIIVITYSSIIFSMIFIDKEREYVFFLALVPFIILWYVRLCMGKDRTIAEIMPVFYVFKEITFWFSAACLTYIFYFQVILQWHFLEALVIVMGMPIILRMMRSYTEYRRSFS